MFHMDNFEQQLPFIICMSLLFSIKQHYIFFNYLAYRQLYSFLAIFQEAQQANLLHNKYSVDHYIGFTHFVYNVYQMKSIYHMLECKTLSHHWDAILDHVTNIIIYNWVFLIENFHLVFEPACLLHSAEC
jgi:hypothetical protein